MKLLLERWRQYNTALLCEVIDPEIGNIQKYLLQAVQNDEDENNYNDLKDYI